jgi:hypothetical protein
MPTTAKNQTVVRRNNIPEPEGFDEELEKIAGTARYKFWTEEEEAKLKRYYGIVDTLVLAEKLGRTRKEVTNKVRDMGLNFKEQRSKYQSDIQGAKT